MPTAETLSSPVASHLLQGLMALRQGDFSHRLPSDLTGIEGKLADTFNEVVAMNQRMAHELERISHAVGRQGRLSQRASLGDVRGSWAASVDSVNTLIDDLVHPTTEMARVIGAVAKGDLSQTMALETEGRPLEGEFRRTAITVNTMVDQLGSFASEVTRVAREVGTEGKLAGQAQVRGVAGTWKDLTDNVNLMAGNLTAQVRNIAEVTTAVANGDLTEEDRRRRQGRVPRTEEHHQHDGRPAPVVCLGGHARGARGRHGRQAGRAGPRRRRVGHVEGPHRLGQLDGRQPHQPGAQHRRRHHRRRPRRPLQADHRRRPGRDARAEEHRQHDGRSALVVCGGSHPRGARGRLGRQAGRPGARRRRVGHVEGPHRLGQLDGRQPHRPGPQHRRRHHRRRQGRPDQEDHGRRPGRDSRAEETPSTRWSTSSRRLRRKSRAWRARSAPKASWAGRPTCPASTARGRTSPTTST